MCYLAELYDAVLYWTVFYVLLHTKLKYIVYCRLQCILFRNTAYSRSCSLLHSILHPILYSMLYVMI